MEERKAEVAGRNLNDERSVLSLLRWTVGILCFLYFLGLLRALNTVDKAPIDFLDLLLWPFTVLLVSALFVSRRSRPLPRWFMPLLLVGISVVPIVAVYVANWLYLRQSPAASGDFLHVGQLFVWMIVALLLVSTHYRVRAILGFIAATSTLALLLAFWQRRALGIDVAPAIQGVAGWLTVFLFAGYFVHQLTKSIRRQQVTLAVQNRKLAEYADAVEQLTVTRERNRLARELHDTLAHTLSAVEMQLKALDILIQRDPAAAQAHLAQTRTLTRDGLQAARRALHDLRVQPVAEFGLLPALARLAQQTAQRTGAEPLVTLPSALSRIPAPVENHLYRIAAEALNNVVRHAQTNRFWLQLAVSDARLRLLIADEGLGFDRETLPAGRLGLRGMEERAALIGASLAVTAAPGQGCRIVVEWEQT